MNPWTIPHEGVASIGMEERPNSAFANLVKYFMDKYSIEFLTKKQAAASEEDKRALKYFDRIIELAATLDKLEKYPQYFTSFYPSSPEEIPTEDAIEHHVHSYMQDFDLLQARISRITGALKNDLKHYKVHNVTVVKDAIAHLAEQSTKSIQKAIDARDQHAHDRTYRDPDIVSARALRIIVQHIESTHPSHAEASRRYDEDIAKAKATYIERAKNNNIYLTEFRNYFAPRFGFIFASLNGHDEADDFATQIREVHEVSNDS